MSRIAAKVNKLRRSYHSLTVISVVLRVICCHSRSAKKIVIERDKKGDRSGRVFVTSHALVFSPSHNVALISVSLLRHIVL